jgi:anti-sigma B factor antagonist
MQLTERRIGDITILDLAGTLTMSDEAGARLKEKITSLVLRGQKQIVFNLSELTYVDSTGLGELVASHTRAWRGGATVKLANVGKRLQDLLVLTKLFTVFEAYDSEVAAIQSFAVAA